MTVEPIEVPPTDTPRRFPLSAEITKGMTKAAVLANFGAPTAAVAGSDTGQLLERFVYVEATSKKSTFIHFVNGSVTRAETFSQ